MQDEHFEIDAHSELLSQTLAMLYPFILVIGAYITLNGHVSPGGGFQGGAIFAAIFMTKHLVLPIHDTAIHKIQQLEKWLLLLILTVPVFFIYVGLHALFPLANPYYYVFLNVLISIKVTCGLTIIFLRFIYFETQ